jgi:4-amino-4-deoxy-L-arabinose transferase-like glycosyltransferase
LAFFVSLLYYFYQFPAILIGFFPWSVLFGPTLIEVVGQIRRRGVYRNSCILASCWFGVWFVFWSICKTKLPHYLLPAYPALAMLTACFVDRWLGDPTQLKSWWLRNAWISMIVVGLGIAIVIAIVIPIVAAIYLPGEEVLGVVGLIPLMGGAWCWWQTSHQRHLHAAIGMAVTAVAFLTATFAWGVARVDRHQNAQPMIAAIRENEERLGEPPTVPPIATYRFFRESTVCYAGHPVTRCEGDDAQAYRAMKDFLDGSPYSYVITTDERKPELDRQFPGRFKVIFEQPCFLSSGNMVVLTTAE